MVYVVQHLPLMSVCFTVFGSVYIDLYHPIHIYWDWSKRKKRGVLPGEEWKNPFFCLCVRQNDTIGYIQDNLIEVLCQSPNHCCMHAKLLELCLTPCDATDCNPPGSSVPGILQARILEWVTIAFSRGSSCISYVSCFVASIALEIISSPVPRWFWKKSPKYHKYHHKYQFIFLPLLRVFLISGIPAKCLFIFQGISFNYLLL